MEIISSGGTPTLSTSGLATEAKQDDIITELSTLSGAVAGTEMQVDVLSMADRTASFTFTQIGDTLEINTEGMGWVGIQVTGSFTATLLAEATQDDSNWVTANLVSLGAAINSFGTQITTVGLYGVGCSGFLKVRLRCTAFTSAPTVYMRASQATKTQVLWAAQSGTWITRTYDGSGNAVNSVLGGSTRGLAVALIDGSGNQITGFATETTLAAIKTAVELIDNAISGSEMQVDVVAALPAGTNEIGAVNVKKSGTATCSNVSGSASSVSLLSSTAGRLGASFFNDSAANLYLKFGTTASTSSFTVKIAPGGYYELPTPHIYTGAIDGIWDSATGAVRITELT